MAQEWRLEMSLVGPCGERYTAVLPLDDRTARSVEKIRPIGGYYGHFPGTIGMEQAVEIMRTRDFRKDLFKRAAGQLSQVLAERMEDAEGWHDIERVDAAKASLSR